MKKLLILLMIVTLLIGTVQGANRFGDTFHNVQVVDETGRNVEDITNLFIYLAGTTTNATIYSDKGRQNTITIPMTEASANTTLVDGRFHWWGPDPYDFSMTNGDGVGPMTNAGHADRNGNEGTLVFPAYLQSISSTSYTDAQTITMGTGSDWVFQAGNVADQLSFTPASDDSVFNVGTSGTGANSSFNVFTGVALGFNLSSSGATHSLTYDGGIVNLNASSNFAVNICTGTSTGATTIGNSAGGAVVIDTDSTINVGADDSYALAVTAGTVGIAATGGDITIDSTDQSVIIRGTEEAGDAIVINADGTAGGIDITSGTGDIVLTSTDDIVLTNATAVGDMIQLLNTAGTSVTEDSSAIQLTATAGGISIQSDADLDDAVVIRADGGTTAEMSIHNDQGTAEDSIHILSDAGGIDIDFATAKNMTVTGGQFTVLSNEDVASAISLTTNTGTSETIIITNTLGSAAGAITLDAQAGAIDINATGASDGDMTVDVGDDYTVTVGGDLTYAVTGAMTLPNNQLRRATVEMTDIEADNIRATPKELIATPGASAMIEFVGAVLALDYGGTAFTESADNLAIRFTNGTGVILSEAIEATGFADATADTVLFVAPLADGTSSITAATASVNQALVLHNTGDGEWGNSGNSPIQIIIYYRIHTTTELGF